MRKLWKRVRHGATAVFLLPQVLKKGDQPLGWLPLANKGTASPIHGWLYLKDEWAKRHPIFDGLPSGGLMDYTFYREIIPDLVLVGQDPPAEAVAGAIKASQDYSSGLMLAVYELRRGPHHPEHAPHPRKPRNPSCRRPIAAKPAPLRRTRDRRWPTCAFQRARPTCTAAFCRPAPARTIHAIISHRPRSTPPHGVMGALFELGTM